MLTITASGVSPFYGCAASEALALAQVVAGGTPSVVAVYLSSDEDVVGVLFAMQLDAKDRSSIIGRVVEVAKELNCRTGFVSGCGLDLLPIVMRDEPPQDLDLSWDETDKQILRFVIS